MPMARPKKAQALDRRLSVRVNGQTYNAYERIAAIFEVPVGQLLRQILTLEVDELEVLVSAMQQSQSGRAFAQYVGLVRATALAASGGLHGNEAIGGGFIKRLRQEAAIHLEPTQPQEERRKL
jgi:hypothetical protein